MFSELVANICMYTTLKGCQETLRSVGIKTHVADQLDSKEQEFVKLSTKEVYSLFGRRTIEYSLTAAGIANSAINKSLEFKTPFKPFIHEIQFTGSYNQVPNWSVVGNWKWEWK